MRRTNRKFLLAFTKLLMSAMFILFGVGCGDVDTSEEANDNPLNEIVQTKGSIKGVIAPLNIDASVIVVEEGEPIQLVMADSEGEYIISDLPAGEFDLEVIAPFHFTDISLKRVQVIPGQATLVEKVTLRSWADAATLTGLVIDAQTGDAIEKANIIIECSSSVCSDLFTATEANGSFKADIWPDLESRIIINKIGYKTENVPLESLGKNGKLHLEFKLEQKD